MKEIESIITYREKEPQRTLVKAATRIFAYEIGAQQKENLQEASELIAQGGRLVMTPNHQSHADYPVLKLSLESNAPEIAKNTVPLWGKKLKDNKVTNFLSAAYNRIPVWPPTIQPKREEREEFLSMNRKAREDAKNVLTRGGHLVIFLEGTRSRNGKLQKGDPRAEVFFKLVPNEFIMPIGITGTRVLLHPGIPVPIPYSPKIVYGKPILVEDLPDDNKVDYIMKQIARLLPPSYRGQYSQQELAQAA